MLGEVVHECGGWVPVSAVILSFWFIAAITIGCDITCEDSVSESWRVADINIMKVWVIGAVVYLAVVWLLHAIGIA